MKQNFQPLEELGGEVSKDWKPYPECKRVGLNWLKKLPNHWQIKPLKHSVHINRRVLPEKTDPDYEMEYLDIGNVTSNGLVTELNSFRFDNAPSRARRVVQHGDTIVSTVRTYLKAITYIDNPPPNLIASTGFAVLSPTDGLDGKYMSYVARSSNFVDAIVSHSQGVSYPAINPSVMGSLPMWFPELSEQRAIASFLDRETAKIDALIAEKEKLLKLLEEKRTAMISHAVTKGLDPNAKMKDSGVPWLGEIPEHWEVKRLWTFIARLTYGFTNPMPSTGDGPYLLTANDIDDGAIRYQGARRTTEEAFRRLLTDKSRPRKGDILITKDGTLGRVAVVGSETVCINQSVAMLRPKGGDDMTDVLQNILRARPYQERMTYEAGGTTIKHIYITRLAKMPIAMPPTHEATELAGHVNAVRLKADSLMSDIRSSIVLLREHRSALISSAVTGKIDVREVA